MYQQKNNSKIKHLDFIMVDLFSLESSFFLSCYMKHGFEKIPVFNMELALILALFDIGVLYFFESYKNILRRGFLEELKAAFCHALLVPYSCIRFFALIAYKDTPSDKIVE